MGLPFFVTPVEPDEVAKTVDKDAAQSRSTIRRQRSVRRPRPEPRPREPRQPFSRHASHLSQDSGADVPELVPVSPSNEVHLQSYRPVDYHEANRAFTRDLLGSTNEMARLRDVMSLDPAIVYPAPTNVHTDSREPRSSRRMGPLARWIERTRSPESHRGPPPPLPLNRRGTATGLGANFPGSSLPALTPNFSPARPYGLQEPQDRRRGHSPPVFPSQPYSSLGDLELTTTFLPRSPPLRDPNSLRELPPLQRMERRSAQFQSRRARVRAARVDGLGDRDRSVSPDGDVVWETMLTTLTPDPQLPSVGSSFTSTSAVTTASSNVESSGTSNTTIGSNRSPTEVVNPAFDPICDLVEDIQDSSEPEDEDTDLEDEDDLYELQDGHGARGDFWRSYADAAALRVDRIARYQGRTETDTLGGMQRIVRRLARREDIPDEWWAEAGLSRNLPRESVRL